MNGIDEYKKMLDTALAVGLPIIGKWTAARICFITYYWGGSREEFTYSPKLHAELEYIQKKYGIEGTSCPDVELSVTSSSWRRSSWSTKNSLTIPTLQPIKSRNGQTPFAKNGTDFR